MVNESFLRMHSKLLLSVLRLRAQMPYYDSADISTDYTPVLTAEVDTHPAKPGKHTPILPQPCINYTGQQMSGCRR
jgi:hypothetical protein